MAIPPFYGVQIPNLPLFIVVFFQRPVNERGVNSSGLKKGKFLRDRQQEKRRIKRIARRRASVRPQVYGRAREDIFQKVASCRVAEPPPGEARRPTPKGYGYAPVGGVAAPPKGLRQKEI